MYKIYLPTNKEHKEATQWGDQEKFIFDWDPQRHLISYTDNLEEADIIVYANVMSEDKPYAQKAFKSLKLFDFKNKILVFVLRLYHAQEYHFVNLDQRKVFNYLQGKINLQNIIIATTNLFNRDNIVPGMVYYDIMMERQQFFFTENEKYKIHNVCWVYHDSKNMFELDTLTKNENAKYFLAPMRIHSNKNTGLMAASGAIRQQLQNLLKQHSKKGYISDHKNGIFLEAQDMYPGIEDWITPENSYGGGTWLPVHNKYYKDSIVSMYVETIVRGSGYRIVSEKTFDPLIKGHFILPYGYKGLVKDILSYGFKLPDWIDYSYDDYYNDDLDIVNHVGDSVYSNNFLKFLHYQTRWKKYVESVNKILNMSQKELYNLYLKDIDILEHNRALFFNRKRTSLLNIILEHVEKRKKGFN